MYKKNNFWKLSARFQTTPELNKRKPSTNKIITLWYVKLTYLNKVVKIFVYSAHNNLICHITRLVVNSLV